MYVVKSNVYGVAVVCYGGSVGSLVLFFRLCVYFSRVRWRMILEFVGEVGTVSMCVVRVVVDENV